MTIPDILLVFFTLVSCLVAEGAFFALLRFVGFYTIVREREAKVYVLFGNVIGVLDEPGLHFLWFSIGPRALLVHALGSCHVRHLGVDQEYIRSTPVNSEEGAPMGIGVWYEVRIVDPVAHVFRNADPQGSLRANVSNATVRCLSNMKLTRLLEDRHLMSQTVRDEVSQDSKEWGYQVGSVYVRKVHFRDAGMVRQIEEKVVNRLRQVTSAIKQDGVNQVNIIASTAEKEAAVEFARAAAVRPEIVGGELQRISQDAEVSRVLFDILETQQVIDGEADIVLLPARSRQDLLAQFSAGAASTH